MGNQTSFYGKASLHRWASLYSELLWIYDGPIAASKLMEESDHRLGYWAWLIRKGSVEMTLGDQTWHAEAGQWMISPQGIVTQSFSKNAVILSIHFQCKWPTGENLFSDPQGCVFDSADFPRLAKTATSLCRLVHRYFPDVILDFSLQAVDYDIFLNFQRLFIQWLSDFNEIWLRQGRSLAKAAEGDDRTSKAVQCMHDTPLNDDFPVKLLQQKTSLGRTHLDRLFWKDYNMTTREYWEQLRKDAAMRYLQIASLSVKEISYRLGFKQASHFTKWFNRHVGITPKSYREQGSSKWIFER